MQSGGNDIVHIVNTSMRRVVCETLSREKHDLVRMLYTAADEDQLGVPLNRGR